MPLRDRDRLRNAFQELRALGYWARGSQEDGWDAVPEDILKRDGKVVFWHANETPIAFNDHGDLVKVLHLQHKTRDSDEIARLLGQYGLQVQIDDDAAAVIVLPQPTETHAR